MPGTPRGSPVPGCGRVQGKLHGKDRSLPQCALHVKAAAHEFHQLLVYGQTQPDPLLLACRAVVHLAEGLKYGAQLFGGNPDSLIRNGCPEAAGTGEELFRFGGKGQLYPEA